MNENKVISVIVPAYNAEAFLDRAVKSVLPQLNGAVELILVDDGSTDGSAAICDAYARDYVDVRVVHKANGGISSARNAGIEIARGEYLMFLDADDYLDEKTCAHVCDVIREHRPDCIDFGWKYVSRSGEITCNHHKIPKGVLLGKDVLERDILPPLLNLCKDPDHFIYDFSCTKVFRRNIVQNNKVVFDENRRIWEDRPFVVHYLKFCRNFYSIDQCFYNYVDMPGSLSRKYSMDFFRIILENYQLYRQLYGEKYDFDTQYVNGYWCSVVENMIFRSLEQTENQAQICKNILETLADPQVIHWYAKRKPQNALEKEITCLVASGQREKVLIIYKRFLLKKNIVQSMCAIPKKLKNSLRHILP